jgi:hypothetical protein
MTFAPISLRARRATDGLAPGFSVRLVRTGWVLLGLLVVLAGIVIAPIPGPGGIPVITLGMVVILRHSRSAKRSFIRAQRRWPRALSPVRRLLRTKPADLLAALRLPRFAVPSAASLACTCA